MAIALEALGVATSREVGEWVERIAHEELAQRASLVSNAESSALDVPVTEASPSAVSSSSTTVLWEEGLESVTSMTRDDVGTKDAKALPGRRVLRLAAAIAVVSSVALVVLLPRLRDPATGYARREGSVLPTATRHHA